MFDTREMIDISRFCAEEVRRQGRGCTQVAWMIEAWVYAINAKNLMTVNFISQLGFMVEQDKNILRGEMWRNGNVSVGGANCPPWQELNVLMGNWFRLWFMRQDRADYDVANEIYYQFELIHPFHDGNGRVGKIIYNHCRGTLLKPEFPKNHFGCSNP